MKNRDGLQMALVFAWSLACMFGLAWYVGEPLAPLVFAVAAFFIIIGGLAAIMYLTEAS